MTFILLLGVPGLILACWAAHVIFRSSDESWVAELNWTQTKVGRLAYRRAGWGKEKILLLHGLGASSYSWRYVLAELAKEYDVLAPDLLGFGFSDRSLNPPLTLIQIQAALEALLEQLDFQPQVVVGSSLGGRLALMLKESRPDLCPQAVCLAPATNGPRLKFVPLIGRWLTPLRYLFVSRIGMVLIIWFVIGNWRSVSRISLQQYMRPYEAGMDLTNFYQALMALRDEFRTSLDGEGVTIVWGRRDRLVPNSVMKDLRQQLPKATWIELPWGSHHPQEQAPEAFLQVLKSCLPLRKA